MRADPFTGPAIGYQTHIDKPKINGNGQTAVDRPAVEKSSAQSTEIHSWNDPDLSILDDRRGDLPEFQVDTLSQEWQLWLKIA
jgi:hypothetical protein